MCFCYEFICDMIKLSHNSKSQPNAKQNNVQGTVGAKEGKLRRKFSNALIDKSATKSIKGGQSEGSEFVIIEDSLDN